MSARSVIPKPFTELDAGNVWVCVRILRNGTESERRVGWPLSMAGEVPREGATNQESERADCRVHVCRRAGVTNPRGGSRKQPYRTARDSGRLARRHHDAEAVRAQCTWSDGASTQCRRQSANCRADGGSRRGGSARCVSPKRTDSRSGRNPTIDVVLRVHPAKVALLGTQRAMSAPNWTEY